MKAIWLAAGKKRPATILPIVRAKRREFVMQTLTHPITQCQIKLRAMIELIDGEMKIYPIADSDEQAKHIMDSIFAWKQDA